MSTATTATRIKILEIQLSRVSGKSIEITIRGEGKFTFGFEGEDATAISKMKTYFGSQFVYGADSGYDLESDYSVLYADLPTNKIA